MPYSHFPHKKIRDTCRICILPEGHKHNSDTDRFHGKGSFCATHATTAIGRQYCNSDGTPKLSRRKTRRKKLGKRKR